jgi:hypothetical protein
MEETLKTLYNEEERAYTSGDYQRASKLRAEIQRRIENKERLTNW